MTSTNQFPGLARGPIDHNASSVINVIADGTIQMGSAVQLDTSTIAASELLPRVKQDTQTTTTILYGIAVGGDADGVYGDGSATTTPINQATTDAGQGVVIVTQGRCLARVLGTGGIAIGEQLVASTTPGVLGKGTATGFVIAVALQPVGTSDTDMIAVDVQREGAES